MEQKNTLKKRLLTILVLSGGEMEYSSLSLMDYARATKDYALRKLIIEEGLVRETYRNGIRALKLRLFDKKAASYMPSLWEGALGYTPRNLFDGTLTGIARKHRLAETLVILSEANISITPDRYIAGTLPPHLEIEPAFTPLSHCKEIYNIPKDTLPGARGFGLVTAPSGIFAVYYVGKNGTIPWQGMNERMLREVQSRTYQKVEDYPLLEKFKRSITSEDKINEFISCGAVLLSGDYEATAKEIITSYTKHSENYADEFHNAYLLPTDTSGIIMLGLMIKAGWRKRLTGLFVKDSERVTDVSRGTHDIDGIVDGIETVCAVDMDMLRITRLAAKGIDNSLNVICFDFQAETLREILPQNFNVLPYPFVDVIRAFYDTDTES